MRLQIACRQGTKVAVTLRNSAAFPVRNLQASDWLTILSSPAKSNGSTAARHFTHHCSLTKGYALSFRQNWSRIPSNVTQDSKTATVVVLCTFTSGLTSLFRKVWINRDPR